MGLMQKYLIKIDFIQVVIALTALSFSSNADLSEFIKQGLSRIASLRDNNDMIENSVNFNVNPERFLASQTILTTIWPNWLVTPLPQKKSVCLISY